jgi:hypothetical protein
MLVIAALLLLPSCTPTPPTGDEIARIPSPDRVVDAVVTKWSGDATVGFVHRVFLVPHGAAVTPGGESLRADHVEGLAVRWESPDHVILTLDEARVFHFSNFWNAREVENFRRTIALDLVRAGGPPPQADSVARSRGELRQDREEGRADDGINGGVSRRTPSNGPV